MRTRLVKKGIYCVLASCLLSACLSTKKITYFQPVSPELDQAVSKIEATYVPVIKAGDILSITVSSLDKEDNEMFNPVSEARNYTTQNAGTIAPEPVLGFTVSASGDISLPILGSVHVGGLTSKALAEELTVRLEQYIKSPTVLVRIANYTVSVLGEVVRPARYTIPNEQISLPEALALAGDLTIYGKRKNVLLIRESNGERQFVRIDLTQRDFFNSPYYYLHSGDILYVEATSGRLTTIDRVYQLTPIVINSLTLMVLILNSVKSK
jgi:polysaccharide export outer membrane protein